MRLSGRTPRRVAGLIDVIPAHSVRSARQIWPPLTAAADGSRRSAAATSRCRREPGGAATARAGPGRAPPGPTGRVACPRGRGGLGDVLSTNSPPAPARRRARNFGQRARGSQPVRPMPTTAVSGALETTAGEADLPCDRQQGRNAAQRSNFEHGDIGGAGAHHPQRVVGLADADSPARHGDVDAAAQLRPVRRPSRKGCSSVLGGGPPAVRAFGGVPPPASRVQLRRWRPDPHRRDGRVRTALTRATSSASVCPEFGGLDLGVVRAPGNRASTPATADRAARRAPSRVDRNPVTMGRQAWRRKRIRRPTPASAPPRQWISYSRNGPELTRSRPARRSARTSRRSRPRNKIFASARFTTCARESAERRCLPQVHTAMPNSPCSAVPELQHVLSLALMSPAPDDLPRHPVHSGHTRSSARSNDTRDRLCCNHLRHHADRRRAGRPISQYIQAFEGARRGSGEVGLLSLNRP